MSRRFYSRSRRAWTPRFWPQMLLDVAIIFPLSMWVIPTTLGRVGMGLFVGGFIGVGRWEVWKWMHPEISREEYMADYRADMRETARWN